MDSQQAQLSPARNSAFIKHKIGLTGTISLALLLGLSACQPARDIGDANEPNDAVAREPVIDSIKNTLTNQDSSQEGNQESNQNAADTSAIATQVATKTQFPRYNISGISALLHPITPINAADKDSGMSSSKSRGGDGQQAAFEEVGTYEHLTHLSNLVFEDIATGTTQKLLPNNNFIIKRLFLPTVTQYQTAGAKTVTTEVEIDIDDLEAAKIADVTTDEAETKKTSVTKPFNHLIYHVAETPYKEDAKGGDITRQQALYMSNVKGQQLRKLHPDNEYVSATEWMPQVSRYYFITQSDSDNNGIIDEKDAYHNYQIDFKTATPVVRKYEF